MSFVSTKTRAMINEDINHWLEYYAKQEKLESAFIKAFIEVESDNDMTAIRYEPHLRNSSWYTKTLSDEERHSSYAYCSMGLMQILFGVAKTHGFKGPPLLLFDPKLNIFFGIKHLKSCIKRYYNIHDVISAYNQGSPRKGEDGKYLNQGYVDKVYKAYKRNGGTI